MPDPPILPRARLEALLVENAALRELTLTAANDPPHAPWGGLRCQPKPDTKPRT